MKRVLIAILALPLGVFAQPHAEPATKIRSPNLDTCTFYVPNVVYSKMCGRVFHDGVSARFGIISNCKLKNVELRIFNRWGEIIWETYEQEKLWDYSEVKSEVYIWQFVYTDQFGERKTHHGHLTVLK
jgi:hypothetical protein